MAALARNDPDFLTLGEAVWASNTRHLCECQCHDKSTIFMWFPAEWTNLVDGTWARAAGRDARLRVGHDVGWIMES